MFTQRLKELLFANHISQKELAVNTGVPTTTVNGWIKTGRKPDYETLITIADFFEVSVDYLVGHSDDYGTIKIQAPGLSEEEQELIDLFRSSSPGEQKAVLTLLKRRGPSQIEFGAKR